MFKGATALTEMHIGTNMSNLLQHRVLVYVLFAPYFVLVMCRSSLAHKFRVMALFQLICAKFIYNIAMLISFFSCYFLPLSLIHCADITSFLTYTYFPLKTINQSASSVLHPGIALATGNGQFGCSDSFPPAVLLCPPTMQGM